MMIDVKDVKKILDACGILPGGNDEYEFDEYEVIAASGKLIYCLCVIIKSLEKEKDLELSQSIAKTSIERIIQTAGLSGQDKEPMQ